MSIKNVVGHFGDTEAAEVGSASEKTWEIVLSNLKRIYNHDLTLAVQKAMHGMEIIVRPSQLATRIETVGRLSELPVATDWWGLDGGRIPPIWVVALSNKERFFGDDLPYVVNYAVDSLRQRPLPANICTIRKIEKNFGYGNYTLFFEERNAGRIVYDVSGYKIGDLVVVGQEGVRGIRHLDQDEKLQLLERERRHASQSDDPSPTPKT